MNRQPLPFSCLTALPVYNEQQHVEPVLREVLRHARDVLVVDDGSTDRTPEILRRIPNIRVLRHPHNRGYGAALVSAFEYAIEHDYDVLVTIDCDGQHQPELIPQIAAAIFPGDDEPYDIVSGSRYLMEFAEDTPPPEDRRRINAEITAWLNEHLGLAITDAFCGLKAYRVDALSKLQITEPGYAMPLQVWVQAARLGLRIREFPVPRIYLEEERSFGGALDDAECRRRHYFDVLQAAMNACGHGAG